MMVLTRKLTERGWAQIALLCLLSLAFGLRVFVIGRQSLWGDEGASYAYAVQSLTTLIADVAQNDPHPPLYYLGLNLWLPLAGIDEFSIRFFSLLPGVLTVSLIYALGKKLANDRVGLIAAVLAAVNPFLIWYSQWARMYSLAVALCLLSVYLFVKLMEKPSFPMWIGYALVSLAALLSHYYAVFIILSENALFIFWLRSRGRGLLRRWILTQGAIALAYIPWLSVAMPSLLWYQRGIAGQVNTIGMVGNFQIRLAWGWSIEPATAFYLTIALMPAFILGLSRLYQRRNLAVPVFYLAVPLAIGLLISLRRPILEERQLLLTAPAYILILAAGIAKPGRWLPLSIVSLLLLFGGSAYSLANHYFSTQYVRGGYGDLTEEISHMARNGDAVVLNGESQILLYDYYKERELPLYFVPESLPLNEERVEATLLSLSERYQGLWLLMSGTSNYDPRGVVHGWMDENLYEASLSQVADGWLAYYKTAPDSPPQHFNQPFFFHDIMSLVKYCVNETTLESGDVLTLELEWSALKKMDQSYKVFVHLRDNDGNIWGQQDEEPISGRRPTFTWQPGEVIIDRIGLRVRPGTPPGQYEIYAGVYNALDGKRLAATQGNDTAALEEIMLGDVTITPSSETPPDDAFGFTQEVGVTLGEDLELLGYDPPDSVRAGQKARITTFWRAVDAAPADDTLVIRVGGEIPEAQEFHMSISSYPTHLWRQGEVVGAVYTLPLTGPWESGEYPIELSLGSLDEWVNLPTPLTIIGRERSYTMPDAQHASESVFGGIAKLVGYDLDDGASARSDISLTLYWQALGTIDKEYAVFIHLLNEQNVILAQHDGPPASGDAPTSSWLAGEFIKDDHLLPVELPLLPGRYRIVVGIYEPDTGHRLTTSTGDDSLVLETIIKN
jgi:hypothetical protein